MKDSERTRALAQLREVLIHELEQSVKHHMAGRYDEVGETFYQIDELVWSIKPKGIREETIEYQAYCVLDAWIHASDHDWLIYDSVKKDDWPRLGLRMKEVLENRREYRKDEYEGILP